MATDSITRRFAAAYGLLSQYAARTAVPPSPAFVQHLPGAVVQEGNRAQTLTIFYGGMVVVLDGCAPEKASELIRLAAAAAGHGAPKPAPALVDMPVARNESLRRFLFKRKHRVTATATAPAPVLDYQPVPFESKDEEPDAKKGKLEVSREEAASWLALGSLTAECSRADERRRL